MRYEYYRFDECELVCMAMNPSREVHKEPCSKQKKTSLFASANKMASPAADTDTATYGNVYELLDAIEYEQMERVQWLVEQDRSLLEQEDDCWTPLRKAAYFSRISMMELFTDIDKYGIPVN